MVNVCRVLPNTSRAPRYERFSISSGAAGGSIRTRAPAASTSMTLLSSSAVMRYCRSDFLTAPVALGSSAKTEANVAERVGYCSTVKTLADRIVTVAAF